LNIHGVNDTRQAEMHTAQSIVPELSSLKIEIATENVNIYTHTHTTRH